MTSIAAVPETPAARSAGPEFQYVRTDAIIPSKTNPRKTFPPTYISELAASMREKGVLEPILVRPHGDDAFELVAGECRWRAAKEAGLEEIPVRIRPYTDKEALEVQVIENLHRQDLHPLEEADGYQQLHEKHGYSIEDLAAKVGKSKGYVYARMKLGALVPAARRWFLAGTLTPSTALLVARIPVPDLQRKAADEIANPRQRMGPMSYREAADHIQQTYMLRLSEAGFPTTDADLVPAAGPCSTCPKRTGNQAELFEDVKSGDVCTDPVCFRSKRDAAFARAAAEAEANGRKVLTEPAAKKLFESYGGLSYEAERAYTTLDKPCYEDGKGRTYGKLLGPAAEDAIVLARNPHTGETVKLLPVAALPKLLKDAGVTKTERKSVASSDDGRYARDQRAREKKARFESTYRRNVLDAIRTKVGSQLDAGDLRVVATGLVIEMWAENRKHVAAIFGWATKSGTEAEGVIKKQIESLPAAALGELLVVMALIRDTYSGPYDGGKAPRLLAAAKHYKVDPEKIRRDLQAAAALDKKKPAAKAKTKKRQPAAARA